MSRRRRSSMITVTDQFCGAGGSSLGARNVGLEVRLALNHWHLAIETHNTNFPDTDHDCTDVSAADPRRYPTTDILITSPECTTHSPAGGTRRAVPQRDLFKPHSAEDPGVIRSRATMFDVPRFAEYHDYRGIICENVVEVLRWVLFPTWLQAMHVLGYQHRIVSMNSMFCHPTPQSRDRIYIVFWKKGNRAPVLDFMPAAPCPRCEKVVLSIQTWKNGNRHGKYDSNGKRGQYFYSCPVCRTAVTPYYYAALNAIDFSVPTVRIADRETPLRPRTVERIQYGLKKYGRTALIVRANMTSGVGCRVRSAEAEPLDTQPASAITGMFSPPAFLVETAYTNAPEHRTRGLDGPLTTQGVQLSAALVGLPFLVSTANGKSHSRCSREGTEPLAAQTTAQDVGVVMPFIVNGHLSRRVYPSTAPLGTQSASREHDAILIPPAFFATLRGQSQSSKADEPLATLTAGGHHGLVIPPAALLSMRNTPNFRVHGLDEAMSSQVAAGIQQFLIQPAPFLASYYGSDNLSELHDPNPSITTVDRHGLVQPDKELELDDCYFRMLQPHEIGTAMAFPSDYKVLGNKREQVKQYGNAVTPPAMEFLIRALTASLAPEVAA